MRQGPVTRFDIRPHLGAWPVAFGMHRDEVHRLLGPPQTSAPVWDRSGFSESYLDGVYNVGYDNAWIADHVGFGPGPIELSIGERAIWTVHEQPDPNPILLTLDSAPVTTLGFWIYLKLGVTTTGYHDDDEYQRALAVFPPSRAGWFEARAVPANTGRYV